ncbi:MAG: cytochrome c maturation protein CcmE [Sulfurimicrobium sp.]|nr:cytochrome c maturation protein CcmE [Sulfurimicrobium sp.]MDP1703255.1 cytochrome c maturation protein CcmE [Sulfurimicrobium sp.]MDP2197002.1 cytochrome c maturation protein CcmE [Sulfurimicrobium sp.]MDP3687208.1 cytochrome c maturation protein CcmE [Sulfurimicrobium sp.]
MKSRHKKLILIGVVVLALGAVAALVLNAFQSNLVFFFSPTQIANGEAPLERAFRIGGLVEDGSLRREPDGVTAHFRITDTAKTIPVTYKGLLPDLFKEGKGVVAEGRMNGNGVFVAEQVLAKHDENYMPPEAASALEQAQKAQQTLVVPPDSASPQEGK